MEVGGDAVDAHLARLQAAERKQGVKSRVKRKPKVGGHPLAYLLDWYLMIRAGAQAGFGHQPISWQEIAAFDTLFGLGLDAFDAESLRRLDVIWLKSRPKRDDGR